jgi:hypothetical protein
MLELPAEMKSAFEKGEFSIRQTSGSFNGIWSDMGTEETIIKYLKGSGGIVGGDASNPHFLNLPIRGYTWSSNNYSTLVSSTDVSIV